MNKQKVKEIKEEIIEALEGKRIKQIWGLIEKVYLKEFKKGNKKDLKIAKEEYLDCEESINDKSYRYLLIEDYNLNDGFYCRFYSEKFGKGHFRKMFEDYFSDCDGCWEEILIIDMKEKKCYLFNKKVKYNKKELKIK